MKIASYLFGFILLTGLAVIIPFYFEEVLYFTVENLGLGWTMTTILIRLVVILLFAGALKSLFKIFEKTRPMKNWLIFVIALVPGFFISFAISPIYDIDYGSWGDDLELPPVDRLAVATNNTYAHNGETQLVAFLDVGCDHCRIAAQKLDILHVQNPDLPIHLFFADEEEDVNYFLEKNEVEHLTFHYMLSQMSFITFAGYEFPSIFVIDGEGKTLYHWIGETMNYTAMDYLSDLEQ